MDNPKISVVVPIYNVQQYLEECLDSLAGQTFKDIEIIMVNDGSTDTSGDIMHHYAEKYSNFIAYDKPNGGLGQARNFGVQYARGEYIAFVDSDDIVDNLAYEKMYRIVSQTNSDMIIGNVVRFNSVKQYPSVLHQKVFFKQKLKAHITRDFELVYDTTAWNKLYRRTFWEKNNFRFPEGMLYEDIPVTFPAHYLAHSVDVLDDVIYYWRARDLGDQSITQQRTDIKNLTDRLKAVHMLNEFFDTHHIEGELKDTKDFKILNVDLLVYLNKLTEAGDDYVNAYIEEVSQYLNSVSEKSIAKLWPIDRMKYYFVRQRDKQKLFDLLEVEKNGELRKRKIIRKNGHYYADYPHKENVPESYLLIEDNLKVIRKTLRAVWKDQTLKVTGYCFIEKIDVKRKSDVNIKFYLVNEESGDLVPIPNAVVTKRAHNTFKFGIPAKKRFRPLKRVYNYDWSGFKLSIDFNQAPFNQLSEGEYFIHTELTVGGLTRIFRVGSPIKGKAPRPRYTSKDDSILYAKYNSAWDLFIYKNKMNNRFEDIEVNDGLLRLIGRTNLSLDRSQLQLKNTKTGLRQTYPIRKEPNSSEFFSYIPIEELKELEDQDNWWEITISHEQNEYPVYIPKDIFYKTVDVGYGEMSINSTYYGCLLFAVREYGAHLSEIQLTEGQASFKIVPPIYWEDVTKIKDNVQLMLLSKNHSEKHFFPVTYIETQNGKGIFSANIHLEKDFKENAFIFDQFDIKLIHGDWTGSLENTYRVYTNNITSGKKSTSIGKITYNFNLENILTLSLKPKWGWIERGALRREVIKRIFYPIARLLPMKKKTIIFESYWGKNYECNSRALYEYIDKNYPEYESVWSLRNPLTHIEGNGVKVRMHSFKYYYYMGRAKYFVNNVNFPNFYRKRKNAVELQTMHGTPLKTLGLDVPGEIKHGKPMEKYLEKNGRWDYLCVPSDYVADIAKRAFAHKAVVLTSGYPRNDKLFIDNKPEKIVAIKHKLGIPLDKKVIFYAPTWRVKNKFKLELDISRLKEKLSDDHILLVKFHHYVADAVNLDYDGNTGFLFDETSYDDIRDLYLIADVLITDYSSVMFDYALLDRPIILFTYDLEQYRDNLRGMYFDIIEKAPGPVCLTNDELLEELVHLKEFKTRYGKQLDSFRRTFNQYDKGNASEQIFNVMFRS